MQAKLKTLPTEAKPNVVVLDVDGVDHEVIIPEGETVDVNKCLQQAARNLVIKELKKEQSILSVSGQITAKVGDVIFEKNDISTL